MDTNLCNEVAAPPYVPQVPPSLLLLPVARCLAARGYFVEVGTMAMASKMFWLDEELWSSLKDIPGRGGRTRLMFAATKGLSQRATWLLARGADVNATLAGYGGCTPLMLASQRGHLHMVTILSQQEGVRLNALCTGAEGDTFTALMLAIHAGHYMVAMHLHDLGADATVAGALTKYTAMSWAIKGNDFYMVSTLAKDTRVSPHACVEGGVTALMLAAETGHGEIVAELCDSHAASLNDVDVDGASALLWACQTGHQAVADFMLTVRGVVVNTTRTSDGMTPLLWASSRGWENAVQVLCGMGADVKAVDSQGRTSLMLAATGGHANVLPHLFAYGAHVEQATPKDGMNALMLGASQGHLEVVSTLLDVGKADINAVGGEHSMTALLWARLLERTDVEYLLVSRGAVVTKGPYGVKVRGEKRGGVEREGGVQK